MISELSQANKFVLCQSVGVGREGVIVEWQ